MSEDTFLCDPVASACNLEEEAAERIDHESLCFLLWECVDSLLGKQPDVIRSRYQGGLTMGRVGEVCGITEAEARKQHTKGLRAIRNPENANRHVRTRGRAGLFLCPLGQRCGALQTDMDSSTERVALRL